MQNKNITVNQWIKEELNLSQRLKFKEALRRYSSQQHRTYEMYINQVRWSFFEALLGAFDWNETPQRHEYWSALANKE